jgi:prepilin-type N-terminal cleavage/methylation domain-containing protein/prepilin-type processing-associated H-X9-DG protein
MTRKSRPTLRRFAGFTLIELLVVMAIIGVLVALLLPAVQKIRDSANNTKCKNNLRQIGLGLFHYQTNYKKFPHGSYCTGDDDKNLTWCFQDWAISILPFIEQDNLYREFDFKGYVIPDGLNENQKDSALQQLVKTFVCPTDPDAFQPINPSGGPGAGRKYMPSNYKAVEGVIPSKPYIDAYWDRWDKKLGAGLLMDNGYKNLRGVLHVSRLDKGLVAEAVGDITDGLSNTIMVGEYTTTTGFSHRAFWAYSYWEWTSSAVVPGKPWTLLPSYDECGAQETAHGGQSDWSPCKRGWSSLHSAGFNFVFCDGAVRLINRQVDMNVLAALATIAGGEVIGDY